MSKKPLPTGVKLNRGKLQVWFTWNGKRYYETSQLTFTEKNADALGRTRAEIVTKIKAGIFNADEYLKYFPNTRNIVRDNNDPMFGEMCQLYLDSLEGSEATRNHYLKALRYHWMPEFQGRPISAIKYSDIRVAIKNRDFKTAKTRNNALVPLRGVFNLAVDDEIIQSSPLAKVKNLKPQKAKPDPFTDEERDAILDHLNKRYHPLYTSYFGLAFFAGMRSPSEMLGLKWDSVDLRTGHVRIQRKVDDLGKLREETKTSVIRDVKLCDDGINYLKMAKPYTFLKGELIYVNPTDLEPFGTPKALRKVWTDSLKKLGIRHRGMNQTRHTCATQWIMSGLIPTFVANQLGHPRS